MKRPYNQEAEAAVVAASIIDRDCAGQAIELDFYDQRNVLIMDAVKTLYVENKEIEVIAIRDLLDRQGHKLDVQYLMDIVSDITSPASFKHHVKILQETNEGRRVWDICQAALTKIGNGERNITDKIIQQLINISDKTTDYTNAGTAAIEAYNYIENTFNAVVKGEDIPFGIPYGFSSLDRLTNGLHNEDLIILASRPGEGKSALGVDLLWRISCGRKNPKTGLLISLEMTRTQNIIRMIANKSGIENYKLHGGKFDGGDISKVLDATNKIGAGDFYIANLRKNHIDTVAGTVLRAKAKFNIDYVIVDYLQLVWGDGRTEYERVTNVSGRLKSLAMDLGIPVIAPCQLNRSGQKDISRSTKMDVVDNPYPRLDDLRSSGAIEQDAGTVIFIHLNKKYLKLEDVPDCVPGKLLVAKNRFGAVGSIPMEFDRRYLRFTVRG